MLRIIALLALALVFVQCPPSRSDAASLRAVVSVAPQKYMLERIAGGRITVNALVKPGADPHSYEPGPAQMRQCAEAGVWFTIGIPFEDIWLDRIKGLNPNLNIISSIKGISRLPYGEAEHEGRGSGEHHGHSHGAEDPHVWLSPMLVREMLPQAARELGKLMPEHAAEFRKNARAFSDELEQLDRDLLQRFSDVPPEKRVFLTYHPSWQYFAHNYQLRQLSIEQDGKEPGPRGMKNIIDSAKALGIRAVFIEPQFAKTSANAIAQSLGARVVVADPLREDLPALYKDMADSLLETFPK